MKKRNLIILLVILSLVLVACGKTSKEEVVFYNWGGTIDKEVITMFEKETGIKVKYSEFDENENMYTVVKNAPNDYDVLVPSDYMVEKMINEGMLAEIDKSKLENFKEIDEALLDKVFDPGNKYSVPMFYGTLGILYNKTMVDPADLHGWDIIFNEKYAGKMWMLDSSRDTLGPGFWHLGYSSNAENPEQLEEVKELMKQQKSYVTAYLHDEIKQHMVNNSGAVAVVYSGEAREAMADNPDLDYYVPEVSNLWIDSFVITKDAPNYENALKLIDFLSRPDIAAMSAGEQGSAVEAVREMEPVTSIEHAEVIYPDIDNMPNMEVYVDLGDFLDDFENAWEEVKNH